MLTTDELIKEYGGLVSGIAHRMIQNREIAKEAAQEAWYEVIRCLPDFRGESSVSTWIYTIARRTILRYVKEEETVSVEYLEYFRSLPEIPFDGTNGEEEEWVKQRCDWCLTAMNHCLNTNARLVFIFHTITGLAYKEIAEIMQENEENIRQINSRSTQRITNFMRDTCMLYNPEGGCKCRIRKEVKKIDLFHEHINIYKIIRLVDFYQRMEKELPRKNYWEQFLS